LGLGVLEADFYMSNVMLSGPSIIRKSGSEKSNLELTNSLRSNFLAAQQDYTPPLSASSSASTDDSEVNGTPTRPAVSLWTYRDGSDYYIPRIDWALSGLAEERSQYDITVKLFYLPGASPKDRAEHTRHAIGLVQKELGNIKDIDLLIVSFPGMSFDGDCEWEADKKNATQGNDEEEIATWSVLEDLYNEGVVKKLGLAEFGSEKLSRFLPNVKVRPQVDQINVKDCCNVPPPLVELAKKENIELLTHNDCTDILPSGTLRELLGQGPKGAGVLAETKRGIDGMKGDLTSQWVVKYTAVVRDRGVVENKGYFAVAELRE
jgi:glutamate--cysteine ligase regulatory subunit